MENAPHNSSPGETSEDSFNLPPESNSGFDSLAHPQIEGDGKPEELSAPEAIDVTDELPGNIDIETAIKSLDEISKERGGQAVSMKFKEKVLRSGMSIDEAYMTILGVTKAQHQERLDQLHAKHEAEQQQAALEGEARMPELIEAGKAYIYPERQNAWEKCVERYLKEPDGGAAVIDAALRIMKLLEDDASVQDAQAALLNENLSGGGMYAAREIIFSFSKRGPEFYKSSRAKEIRAGVATVTDEEKIRVARRSLANDHLELKSLGVDDPDGEEFEAYNDEI